MYSLSPISSSLFSPLFEDLFADRERFFSPRLASRPALRYDLKQTGEGEYDISLAVPGFARDEIELSEHEGVLVIQGTHQDTQGAQDTKDGARAAQDAQDAQDAQGAHGAYVYRGIDRRAFCHRFHPPLRALQALIQSGRLGRLAQIENRFGFRFARAGASWFTDADIAGGGILIDTLAHSIDIFRALTSDEVESAQAQVSSTLPIAVEDSASLLLRSRGGILGSLNCSWVTPVSEAIVRVHGTEGQALLDYNAEAGLRYKLADDADWTAQRFDEPDRFVAQADCFLRCIETGEPPLVGGEDGLAVMRVIEAAYKSAGVAR